MRAGSRGGSRGRGDDIDASAELVHSDSSSKHRGRSPGPVSSSPGAMVGPSLPTTPIAGDRVRGMSYGSYRSMSTRASSIASDSKRLCCDGLYNLWQSPADWNRAVSLVAWGFAAWITWDAKRASQEMHHIMLRDDVFLVVYNFFAAIAVATTHGFVLYQTLSHYPYDMSWIEQRENYRQLFSTQSTQYIRLTKLPERSLFLTSSQKEKIERETELLKDLFKKTTTDDISSLQTRHSRVKKQALAAGIFILLASFAPLVDAFIDFGVAEKLVVPSVNALVGVIAVWFYIYKYRPLMNTITDKVLATNMLQVSLIAFSESITTLSASAIEALSEKTEETLPLDDVGLVGGAGASDHSGGSHISRRGTDSSKSR